VSEEQDEDEEVDLARALGASAPSSVQVLTLYVPSKDRLDQELPDQRRWVLEAAEILARINGGVTILPPVEGGCRGRVRRQLLPDRGLRPGGALTDGGGDR
jgi:hypothetical protein